MKLNELHPCHCRRTEMLSSRSRKRPALQTYLTWRNKKRSAIDLQYVQTFPELMLPANPAAATLNNPAAATLTSPAAATLTNPPALYPSRSLQLYQIKTLQLQPWRTLQLCPRRPLQLYLYQLEHLQCQEAIVGYVKPLYNLISPDKLIVGSTSM